MSVSYLRLPALRRPFVITPYSSDASGVMRPVLPACCPAGAESRDPPCRIGVHDWRKRKAGPDFPLAVVRCHRHQVSFTLYPPGFGPYRREPVVKLAPDGAPIIRDAEGGDPEATEDPLREDFENTLLQAAVDARDGLSWRRPDEASADGGSWSTQCRHLGLGARILGLARDVSARVVETIGQVLSVETLHLRDQRSQIGRGYRSSGQVICSVLARLRRSARRAWSLLWCGYLTGCWGEPWLWDARRKVFDRGAFPRPAPASSATASRSGGHSHEMATFSIR